MNGQTENAAPAPAEPPRSARAARRAKKKQEKQMRREARAQAKAARKAEKRRLREEKKKKRFEKRRRLLFPADKNGWHKIKLLNFMRFLLYPVQRFLFPHRLYGNVPVGPGAFIYISNHFSIWDAFFVARTTRDGVHFLAKEQVLHVPVMGAIAIKMGTIGAVRDGSDVRSVMDCIKVLKNGEKIVIFPEGTRNKRSDETFLPFYGGAALLAIKTKTPVIPIVICARPHLFRKTPVVVGEPLELTQYYGRKLTAEEYAEADAFLEQTLYAMRDAFRAAQKDRQNKKKGSAANKANGDAPEGSAQDADGADGADGETP